MDAIKKVIGDIEEAANRSIQIADGDYKGEDGLWYCGKCRTKKQTRVEFFGETRTPMCLCKCAKEAYDAEREAEKRAKRAVILRENAFPDKSYETMRLERDNGSNPKLTNVIRNFTANFGEFLKSGYGLLLHGDVGRGKTYMAVCAANAVIDRGYPAIVTSVTRIANELFAEKDKQGCIDGLDRFALLVLDDFGAERSSEYMTETAYNIIDGRIRAGLPMIVTTNLTLERIKKPEGADEERIYNRLISKCRPIEVTGTNQRNREVRQTFDEVNRLLGIDGNVS